MTLLGIALPVILMMGLWHFLAGAPAPAKTSQVPTEPRPAPVPRQRRGNPETLKFIPPASQPAASRPESLSAPWTDVVDSWLSQLEEAARNHPDSQRTAATLLLQQGRFEAAAEAFDRLLVRAADDPLLLTGKAMALAALDQHEDALPLFASAMRADSDSPAMQFNYAVGLMRAGERDRATTAFAALLESHPDHVKALFNVAILDQAAGRAAKALDVWRRLTDGDPTSQPAEPRQTNIKSPPLAARLSPRMLADAWSHRGELALQLKRPTEAEMCFLNVVRLEPRNAAAWCNVGIARADQVRRSDALTALQIALQIDPRLVPALNQAAYLHAAIYRDLGSVEDGRAVAAYCRRSLDVQPHQPNIIELLRAASWFDREEHAAEDKQE